MGNVSEIAMLNIGIMYCYPALAIESAWLVAERGACPCAVSDVRR